jgi:CheY-like chemotaxis protein
LQQIQVNLLMNAAKYTPAGGTIWYKLGAEEGQAVIRCRDTGVGLAPELLDRIFDPFVQADTTLDRAGGGIGVGLTLVRALVELHGGTVEARSDGPGQGSEFIVRLPLSRPATVVAPRPAVRNSPPALPRLRLLIVEDDPDIRSSLKSILELDGHTVHTVGDGVSALSTLDQSPIDVALIDIGIPEMSGYELARRVRERFAPARLAMLALTGYGQDSDRQEAFEAGFDGHLTKPFHPGELNNELAAMLARGRAGAARGDTATSARSTT